ncbi:hypothetical protein ACWCQZ_03740 [Streptomyces sp. NPDC002285]
MSPEQFSSPQDVGPAADIFSLGSVVAYAATGHGPFDSPSPYETAVRVVDGTPELDNVPPDLLPFVHFRLEKHPKSRPTPDELLGLLRDGRIPEPRPPEPTKADKETSPVRPPRRRRHLWSAIALGAALLTAVTAVTATTVAVTDDDSAPACLPAGRQAGLAQEVEGPECRQGADRPRRSLQPLCRLGCVSGVCGRRGHDDPVRPGRRQQHLGPPRRRHP